ncbi:MAG: hypothetical protein ACLR23_17935 [Clostridia bacterium]
MDYVGYKEFNAGETKTFGGVRLLGDDQFSVTVAAEKFPYYYELVWCDVKPLPMHVLAPGASIEDTGNGATLSDNFTVDLIREPILNSESGYRYKPTVTCGPYRFVQYDPSTKQSDFGAQRSLPRQLRRTDAFHRQDYYEIRHHGHHDG